MLGEALEGVSVVLGHAPGLVMVRINPSPASDNGSGVSEVVDEIREEGGECELFGKGSGEGGVC